MRSFVFSPAFSPKSRVSRHLQPLVHLQKSQVLWNQTNPASFCKTPGVGVGPPHCPGMPLRLSTVDSQPAEGSDPFKTFRCVACIPNVFSGRSDLQDFRTLRSDVSILSHLPPTATPYRSGAHCG